MNYREKIRKAIECPQLNNVVRYGEWGALNLEQRKYIKRLLDEVDSADDYYKRVYLENKELKKQLHEASLTIQEMTEQDIECPSNCEKLRQLKKQVEENKDNYNCLLKQKEQFEYIMSKQVDYQGQQKEFIKYLEDEIYSIEPKGTGINYNCEYDSEGDYVNAMKEQSRLNTFKEILQKYKSIIGVSDENNKQ